MISQPASQVRCLVLIIVSFLVVSACSSTQVSPVSKSSSQAEVVNRAPAGSVGEQAAAVAVQQVGVPYRYGGSTPSGFDCSGLVQYSYSRVGKSVPRTTGQLWKDVIPVEQRNLRAGDILFFSMSGKMSHVGLYLGGNRFVHAPSTGKTVSIQTLRSEFYKTALVGAGRPN
jgi:cell wall-associated NlpC family hydrolase